jgi:hypothetical protein
MLVADKDLEQLIEKEFYLITQIDAKRKQSTQE